VRLVGIKGSRKGRVEVFHNDTWGTVCDHYITDIMAKVVCSQLGYGYVVQMIAIAKVHYSQGPL